MGRPINKKYFAVAGEGVASVAVTGTFGSKTPGTYTIPASVISAPQLTGGVKPTMTLTYLTASTATVAVVTAGSGYTGTTTISGAALQALGGAGTGTIVLTATMSSGVAGSIKAEVQIGSGGSELTTGDIIKQVSTRRYKVQTTDGTAVCKLVQTAALGENEMSITATDSNSNAYFVQKLTAHKAVLTRKSSGSGDFATGASVKWTLGLATSDTVSIESQ
jgi:hypothetical protein